jgi:hypothetical protein
MVLIWKTGKIWNISIYIYISYCRVKKLLVYLRLVVYLVPYFGINKRDGDSANAYLIPPFLRNFI